VEVLAADDECAVHLGGNDGAGEDTATDGDLAGERALLVCVRTGLLALAILSLPIMLMLLRIHAAYSFPYHPLPQGHVHCPPYLFSQRSNLGERIPM